MSKIKFDLKTDGIQLNLNGVEVTIKIPKELQISEDVWDLPYVLTTIGEDQKPLYVAFDNADASYILVDAKKEAMVFIGEQADPIIDCFEQEHNVTPYKEPLNAIFNLN